MTTIFLFCLYNSFVTVNICLLVVLWECHLFLSWELSWIGSGRTLQWLFQIGSRWRIYLLTYSNSRFLETINFSINFNLPFLACVSLYTIVKKIEVLLIVYIHIAVILRCNLFDYMKHFKIVFYSFIKKMNIKLRSFSSFVYLLFQVK